MRAAAIDLGTNSIKILIVKRGDDGHMQVLFRHRVVVRLGEGTFSKKNKGKIPRHVQLRTLKVFQTYAKFLEAYKVDVVRATGTAALREAKNGPEFVEEVRTKTGIALETLPAGEEARLIVKGVASEIPVTRKPVLFIDIGGGSCEVSLVKNKKIERFVSLPLGAVRLTELFLTQSKPDAQELRPLCSHIRKVLKKQWPNPPKVKLAYGSAGTIRALARLVSKTELSDDDRVLSKKNLERVSSKVSKLSTKKIASLPGIDSKRAEILTAGANTLREIFEYFGIDKLRVSNRGLREGMLIDLFEHPQRPAGMTIDEKTRERLEFLGNIGRRYNSNRSHCYQVWALAFQLFDELAPLHGLSPELKPLLMASAVLHDVGRYISDSSKHKHSYYILQNTELPFFEDREKLMVAVLARYHRKSPPRVGHEGYDELNPQEKKTLEILASILRLADSLDANHDQAVKWLKCQWGPGKVRIGVELKNGATLNEAVIADKGKLFEDLFKVKLTVLQLAEKKTRRQQSQTHSQISEKPNS